MLTLIFSFLLVLCGVGLIVFLLSAILRGFGLSFSLGGILQAKTKRLRQKIVDSQTNLENSEQLPLRERIGLIENLWFLSTSTSFSKALQNLHLAYLDAVVSLLEDEQIHFERLEVLEDLLQERNQLLQSIVEIESAQRKVATKPSSDWAKTELRRQQKEQAERLEKNSEILRSTVRQLLSVIATNKDRTTASQYH